MAAYLTICSSLALKPGPRHSAISSLALVQTIARCRFNGHIWSTGSQSPRLYHKCVGWHQKYPESGPGL